MMNLLAKLDDSVNEQLSILDLVIIPEISELNIIEQSAFGMQALRKINNLADFSRAMKLLRNSCPNINLDFHDQGIVRIFNNSTSRQELKFRVQLSDALNCIHSFLFNHDATRFID